MELQTALADTQASLHAIEEALHLVNVALSDPQGDLAVANRALDVATVAVEVTIKRLTHASRAAAHMLFEKQCAQQLCHHNAAVAAIEGELEDTCRSYPTY